MDDNQQRSEYRKQLLALEQKAQEAYDKAVLSLSGGALGVSFAFVNGFIERDSMHASGLLITAWAFWAASVAASLSSHLSSQHAMRRAIREVDAGRSPGSFYDKATQCLNVAAGLGFVVGVVFIMCFVWRNV